MFFEKYSVKSNFDAAQKYTVSSQIFDEAQKYILCQHRAIKTGSNGNTRNIP